MASNKFLINNLSAINDVEDTDLVLLERASNSYKTPFYNFDHLKNLSVENGIINNLTATNLTSTNAHISNLTATNVVVTKLSVAGHGEVKEDWTFVLEDGVTEVKKTVFCYNK